jgi:hypothetical protein
MISLKPEITIEVRFLTAAEGGNGFPIPLSPVLFGCVFQIEGKGFDCRILKDDGVLVPGETYLLPVKFLFWDDVKKHLSVGKEMQLWGGRVIARGTIKRIVAS